MKPGQIAFGADPGPPVVDREILGEDDDPALGRVVRATAGGAFEPFHARDRHDAAPLAVDRHLFEHVPDRVLRTKERSGQVDVENALPLVSINQMSRAAAGDAGRGDDRVDAAVLGHHFVDGCRDRVLVTDIGLHEGDFGRAAGQFELGAGFVHVEADHAGTFGGESGDAGESDPRGGAGDERGLTVESSHFHVLVRPDDLMES